MIGDELDRTLARIEAKLAIQAYSDAGDALEAAQQAMQRAQRRVAVARQHAATLGVDNV